MKLLNRVFSVILIYILLFNLFLGSFRFYATEADIKNHENGFDETYVPKLVLDESTGDFYLQYSNSSCLYSSTYNQTDDFAQGVYKTEEISSLIIYVYNLETKSIEKKNTAAACVKSKNVDVKKIDSGYEVKYYFKDVGIVIPLVIKIEKDFLSVSINTSNIKEEKTEKYLLSSIAVLPFFGAAKQQESGYIVVPDGCGAYMYFDSEKSNTEEYSASVYGEDLTSNKLKQSITSQTLIMPVYGVKKGDISFLTVTAQGSSSSTLHAIPAMLNTEYTNIYNEFILRSTDQYIMNPNEASYQSIPIIQSEKYELDNIEQRYYFLENDNCDFNGMAKKYQSYLKENGFEKEAVNHRGIFLDYYCAVKKKESFLGIPLNKTKILSTYEKIETDFSKLNDKGIAISGIRLLNWSKDQLSGKIDIKLNEVNGIGKRNMVNSNLLKSLIFGIELQRYTKGGNGFSSFDCARNLMNAPAYQYDYFLSTGLQKTASRYRLLSPSEFPKVSKKISKSIEKRDIYSVSPLSSGTNVYGDYSNQLITRQDTIKYTEDLLKTISTKTNLVMEYGGIYALKYADKVINVPVKSSGFDMFDGDIPFLQLVLSGMIPYVCEPINLENDSEMFLTAIQTGASLHYSIITEDTKDLINTGLNFLYASKNEDVFETIIYYKNIITDCFNAIDDSELLKFYEVCTNVTKCDYSNGVSLLLNKSGEDISTEYGIVKAQGILVCK